jgi:hypothetical protein
MNSIRGIVTPEIQKFLQQKENEFNVEIATKSVSKDVQISEIKKEFEDLKIQFRELVLTYLRDNSTDEETKDFLLNNASVKNLMEEIPEYNILLYKRHLIKDGGKIYDENYQ